MDAPATPPLILASSSAGRRQLMGRLGLAFEAVSPDIDERRRAGEPAAALARRLAQGKAGKIAAARADAIVIGADQVADVDGEILGKPGTRARAVAQLQRQSGRTVVFHSGLCVHAPGVAQPLVMVERVVTRFRELSAARIERYVAAEDVTQTAGSLKSEGLGIALVAAIESRDPSALVGLPLIGLCDFLAQAGISLP